MISSTAANTSPPADAVKVTPSPVAAAKNKTASAGKIQADRGIGPCALMSPPSLKPRTSTLPRPQEPSTRGSADELSGCLNRTIIVQVVMASFRKPHELFRFMGEREQMLAQSDRNCWIAGAMHDQKPGRDTRYARVGSKRIPDQPTYRHESKPRGRHVRNRRIGASR